MPHPEPAVGFTLPTAAWLSGAAFGFLMSPAGLLGLCNFRLHFGYISLVEFPPSVLSTTS